MTSSELTNGGPTTPTHSLDDAQHFRRRSATPVCNADGTIIVEKQSRPALLEDKLTNIEDLPAAYVRLRASDMSAAERARSIRKCKTLAAQYVEHVRANEPCGVKSSWEVADKAIDEMLSRNLVFAAPPQLLNYLRICARRTDRRERLQMYRNTEVHPDRPVAAVSPRVDESVALRGDLRNALLSLSERERSAIAELCLCNFSNAQHARRLGVPISTYCNQVSRARGLLARRLSHYTFVKAYLRKREQEHLHQQVSTCVSEEK